MVLVIPSGDRDGAQCLYLRRRTDPFEVNADEARTADHFRRSLENPEGVCVRIEDKFQTLGEYRGCHWRDYIMLDSRCCAR